jgi:hypothetical protein
MSIYSHRPPRQRTSLGGLRGDIELTHHQIKVILQMLQEASADSIAGSLGAPSTTVQHVIASLQDPLETMDCWLDEHWDWLHRKWPYDKDPSEEELISVTAKGPDEEDTFVIYPHKVSGLRCRWCWDWVHYCNAKQRCFGVRLRGCCNEARSKLEESV